MKTLDQRLGWLGGIIDGEGTIVFWLETQKYVRLTDGQHTKSLRMDVAICNTDESLIREVVSIFTDLGIKHQVNLQPRGGRAKACWYVKCGGTRQVVKLLTAVIPHLVSKRHRAELALQVIAHRKQSKKGRQAHLVNDPTQDVWLTAALGELKHLNARGPAVAELDV